MGVTDVNHRDTENTETHREWNWQPTDAPMRPGCIPALAKQFSASPESSVSLWLTSVDKDAV